LAIFFLSLRLKYTTGNTRPNLPTTQFFFPGRGVPGTAFGSVSGIAFSFCVSRS